MGLQVGNRSARRSVHLRFFLYPAVETYQEEYFSAGVYTSPIQEAED
jgi:hypothetical protein